MQMDICVVNYNTQPLLQRFIESVTEYDYTLSSVNPYAGIYIADNGSTDGSVEYLKTVNEPFVKHIAYNENIGFAAACNQLAAMGDSEFLGLFNADVWMPSDKVRHWNNIFIDHPEIAILGVKQRNERGEIVHAGIFGTLTAPTHRGWKQFDPDDEAYLDLRQCLTVSGSAYLVRRKIWDELTSCPIYQEQFEANGAFLPTPHYYEETWCSYHAHSHGHQVWYDGTEGSIGHSWHASSEVGGEGDKNFYVSQAIFRKACDNHGIPHD